MDPNENNSDSEEEVAQQVNSVRTLKKLTLTGFNRKH